MSFLDTLLGRWSTRSSVQGGTAPRALQHASSASPHTNATDSVNRAIDAPPAVLVKEIPDAGIAAELFRRKFGQDIPDFPKHFVAMIGDECAGYVHYTPWQGDYLCGGLCIDDRVYRRLAAEQRAWIRERGGIAEIMMRAAHAQLSDATAIWGYIGDKQAEAVDRRVGFVPVAEPYLFAIWKKPLNDAEKATRVAQALALGPF
jgi:hypothetical protein